VVDWSGEKLALHQLGIHPDSVARFSPFRKEGKGIPRWRRHSIARHKNTRLGGIADRLAGTSRSSDNIQCRNSSHQIIHLWQGNYFMRPYHLPPEQRLGRWIRRADFLGLASLLIVFTAGGCGDEAKVASRNFQMSPEPAPHNLKQIGLADQTKFVDGSVTFIKDKEDGHIRAMGLLPPSEQPADGGAAKTPGPPTVSVIPRKMIYDASIDLIVESLNNTEQAVLKLINDHSGFLAESDQNSDTREQRRATWRVRVPADRFDSFVGAVGRLGEVQRNRVGTQDVTEEYVDLEARIRNKQEEEKRLVKHLSASTGNLKDILDVERELSRVRGEVEQMQGRLRFLSNRTELSTVTINAMEWKDYKPPVAVTYPTRIGRTFFRSVENLADFGTSLSLVLVALIPWIPLIALGLFLVRALLVRLRRKSPTARSVSAPAAS
jgi:hypothetical protein